MPTSKAPRNDALRKRMRVRYANLNLPCGICEQPIDWSLRYPDPLSGVVDHIIPLDRGGPDVATNMQAACAACNRAKWNRMPGEESKGPRPPRTFVTSRVW